MQQHIEAASWWLALRLNSFSFSHFGFVSFFKLDMFSLGLILGRFSYLGFPLGLLWQTLCILHSD